MKDIKKPFWWTLLLVVLGSLYLFPEAIFNSELVSLVGLGTPSASDIEHLELFGRAVSGVGVTLLLADFLPGKWVKNPLLGILSLGFLLLLVWPLVFFGQKYLVENAIIESSSAQQRQHAVFSASVRDALAANVVKIRGVEYNPEFKHTPESMTFLSLFGGLMYADAALSDALEDNKRDIIQSFVKKRAYEDFESHFNDYSKLYERLSKDYERYRKASNDYNNTLANIPTSEAEYWADLETQVEDSFSKYLQAKRSHAAKASIRAQEYGPKVYAYFEKVNKCRERYKKSKYKDRLNKCILKHQARYKTDIMKAGIGYIEPNYWLIAKKVSTAENITNSVIAGALTGGLSTALQLISAATGGDAGMPDYTYTYTSDPDHYQQRFLTHPNFFDMFEKETGYPQNITSLVGFRSHATTQSKLRKELADKRLDLDSNWSIDDRAAFTLAVDKKIRAQTNSRWYQEVRKQGLNMQPNLSWEEFQLHSDIQAKIKSHMGDNYVKNTRADWNKRSFKQKVVDPNIESRTNQYLAAINSSVKEFEDTGKFADYGKQALRSVIVPPISMFISLFLICLTLAKLPGKYWALIRFKQNDTEQSSSWVGFAKKVYMPLLILLVPLLFFNNTFTNDKNNTANYFLAEVEKSSVPLVSYLLKWTLHTQPFLHPLGAKIEESLGLYQAFHPYADNFHHLDKVVLQSTKTLSAKQKKDLTMRAQGNAMLMINVEDPSKSKIQIMNIVPAYSDDIILKPGLYDIKVTKSNGSVYRQKHRLSAGYHVLDIL